MVSGKIAVCALNGELTAKRLVREQGQWLLKPENPNYPTIPPQAELELVIWGVVIRVIHNLQLSVRSSLKKQILSIC